MRRRRYAALILALSLGVVAVPVSAHDFTGSEERQCGTRTRPRTCYTNDVRCNRGAAADAGGVRVYRHQSGTTSGGIGVCNDGTGPLGSRVPVQGRAVAQGSQNGGSIYVDGDKHNANETARGWARVDGSTSARSVKLRCGDDKGRRDASHPTSADTQQDCG